MWTSARERGTEPWGILGLRWSQIGSELERFVKRSEKTSIGISVTRDRCYDFLKIFSPKNSAKKLAFLTQNKAKICNIFIITLVFEKNANFFAENCKKIAENCDHNIDARLFFE
jgi:hypothetical protein